MIAMCEVFQLFTVRVNSLKKFIKSVAVCYAGKAKCVYFVLLLFIWTQAIAQPSDINFISFSSKDGLSSSSVNAIIKDKYGYMWFATDDGLDKFDGINFTVYRHNTADSTTIGGNIVTAFHEDHDGNLWVGNNYTLSLYDRKKDAFRNYHFLGNGAVRAIFSDHRGNLWVGGYSGLYRFNPKDGTVKNYHTNSPKNNGLTSNTILSIFEDTKRRLWIGTNAGLHLFNEQGDSFINFSRSDNNTAAIADNVIRSITEDSNGNVWFGTNNGFSKLQQDGKTFINYTNSSTDFTSVGWHRVYSIKADKLGQLWVGTEEGVNVFNIGSEKSLKLYPDKRNKYSLKGKSVRSIFIDDSGIYWVGTFHGGINKYDKNLAFFSLRESNPFDPSGLSSSVVTSFIEDPSGDIYVGTDGGGLNLYHRKTGVFSHPNLTQGGNRLSIMTMEMLGTELWVGTYGKGLYVFNTVSGRVQHFKKGNVSSDLSNDEIFCLKKDSKGNMWIGTNGEGVNVYNPKTGTIDRLDRNAGSAEIGFTKNWFVRSIEEDRFGNLWIASNGAGIGIYDPSQKTFNILNTQNSGLPSNIVMNLHLDQNGRMWAGTLGGGLSLFDSKTGKFVSYSEKEGLSNAIVYKILEDNSGNFWVSTNNGISSFNSQAKKFKNYSYQNGLQRSTFCMGSGLKTTNGELFFGGLDGFNYFEPLSLHSNRNVPSLQFTALKISNRTIIPGEDEAIKDHVSIANEIRLDFKQNFSLDFIALNYTAPRENRYAYKLDGFDGDWNIVGESRTAVYTNLDPGEYTFRVKASSEDGAWTTPEKTIRIYVRPPFWRTVWAYIFYLVFAFAVVVLYRRQGMQKLKNKFALEQERLQVKQMIEQERKEAERQHEFDQLRIKFLTNLSHEFRTPISLIAGPVDKLLSQENDTCKKNQLSMVKRNAGRLLNLVNQLLDFKKLEQNELNLNLGSGDIISFIRDIAESFKDAAEAKQINYNFSTSISECTTLFDRDKIERLLFNLLSNAFKFTPKDGKISLEVQQAIDSNLKITVTDSGIGMSPEVRDKIFDRFFQAIENNGVLNQGNGIGLSIAKEFVRLHGGTIDVESTPGRGSTFTVMLPCPVLKNTSESVQTGSIENRIHSKSQLAISEHGPSGNFTVLLIEDNEDFRQYLRDSLKPFYKVVEATNGKEGWQKVLSTHPQVVVSDINMPIMDGITLSKKIKSDKRTSHIPIVLLTAMAGDLNQLKGLETGAVDYLTKPFNFEILNVKIKNLVALNQNLKNTYSKQLQVLPSEIEVESEDEKLLSKIIQYIEVNIDSPNLSVEELSKHAFMSRGSLYSKIIEMTGETPVEFIRSIKLKKAAALLEKSDMKVSQIGYAVGFSSPNYFARAFKAKYNLSPSEYAENIKG